jgi:hypothetical protein
MTQIVGSTHRAGYMAMGWDLPTDTPLSERPIAPYKSNPDGYRHTSIDSHSVNYLRTAGDGVLCLCGKNFQPRDVDAKDFQDCPICLDLSQQLEERAMYVWRVLRLWLQLWEWTADTQKPNHMAVRLIGILAKIEIWYGDRLTGVDAAFYCLNALLLGKVEIDEQASADLEHHMWSLLAKAIPEDQFEAEAPGVEARCKARGARISLPVNDPRSRATQGHPVPD